MVNVPPILLSAVVEQRAVLFLGAGASLTAKHPKKQKIPQGNQLRDLICGKFLGGNLVDKPLNVVAAVAASEAGLPSFQSYIRDLFLLFEPSEAHLLIPQFRWRAIATTNFDLIIEKSYEKAPNRRQFLVKTIKDGDQFDIRLHKETDPVAFYKLHGCIDHYTDYDVPIIIGMEQYASYDKNRKRFYSRFRDLGQEYPIIFVGYSISDPHIQKILFDLTDVEIPRPSFYTVAPGFAEPEVRFWASNKVVALDCTFEDFINTLDREISTVERAIPLGIGGGELSIRQHYNVAHAAEPAFLKNYLSTDVEHIYSGLTAPRQDPKEFYRGYDEGFGCILQNLDAKRTLSDSVLVDAILLSEESRRVAELFMLKGPGGNGKTVILKRLAWESGVTYAQLSLYPTNAAALYVEPLAEIHRLTGKRIFLFVDHVSIVRSELYNLLRASRRQSIPLTVIGTETDSEWNTYCEQLEPFVCQEFPVRYLNEREILELISLLERHNALGLLKDRSLDDRLRAFTEAAGRQLLVALHEATLGVPFEEIVVNEFQRVEPATARNLYLDICTLHQFGAWVRAGLISRVSGIGFDRFRSEFIRPLENVVLVVQDAHSHDVYYRSRHPHVSEIVFNRALPAPEDKFDTLARLVEAINVDYSSDRETFSRLIKGRRIAEIFPNVQLGRLFYDHVQKTAPDDPFVCHQRAVFEMQNSGGSLELAEAAAARAFELNPKSNSIQHTQAEIARRRANETDDPLRKRALRRVAREKLGGFISRLSEYDFYTRARLAIDEFTELSSDLDVPDDRPPPLALVQAAKEAEDAIQLGLQLFPESSELLLAESILREHLEQTDRALQALERAFDRNPRQDWLAVRLVRKYLSSGDFEKSRRVLDACLQVNPSSKSVHLEIGRICAARGDKQEAIEHLKRSFTDGDNQYEAQYWYARELFIQGYFSEAEKIFSALNDRAPGRFRTRSAAVIEKAGSPILYDCSVARKEESYAFLKLLGFPKDVFASRADSDPSDWGELHAGANAKCAVAFNRRGPCATKVRLRS